MTVADQSWRDRAECKPFPLEMFYPARGVSTEPAKAVCHACPVEAECLADALATCDRYGIRGGKSERQRRIIRNRDSGTQPEMRRLRVAATIRMTAAGYTTTQIAEQLDVTTETILRYRRQGAA